MKQPEKQSSNEADMSPSIDEMTRTFKNVLTPEDIEDLKGMEELEAVAYLYTLLPEYGIEDPEAVMRATSLIEETKIHSEEEMDVMNGPSLRMEPYNADDIE